VQNGLKKLGMDNHPAAPTTQRDRLTVPDWGASPSFRPNARVRKAARAARLWVWEFTDTGGTPMPRRTADNSEDPPRLRLGAAVLTTHCTLPNASGQMIRSCCCFFSVFLLLSGVLLTAAMPPPNVVLIMTDDQGSGDFGFAGNSLIETPTLDRLAAESVRFNRFYVSPVCAPTRASLLTGRYHLRTGTWGVAFGRDALNPGEITLAAALRRGGYRTGMIGKWHNGEHYPSVPLGQGFDEFVGFRAGHWNEYFDPPLERNGRAITGSGYITDYFTDEAIRFIHESRARPFFLYLAYNAPHTPLFLPDRYLKKYQAKDLDAFTAAIYGMVNNIDDNLARLLGELKDSGLVENTIVIFLTDNGPNSRRYNQSLRGIKASIYEGGSRTPLLVRWPGQLPAGKVVDVIAAHIDIFPTVLELCGVEQPATRPLDGRSLVPLLRDAAPDWPERALYMHAESPATWRPEPFPGVVRTQQYNLVNGTELYDIVADPREQQNVADRHPEKVLELRSRYAEWFMDVSTDRAFLSKRIPVGHTAEPVVALPAPHARFKGGLRYFDQGWPHDWITNWSNLDDSAAWEIEIVHEGWYSVGLQYRCPPPDIGAEVSVEIGGTTLYGIISQPSAPTPPKSSPKELGGTNVPPVQWETLRMGKLWQPAGPAIVTVRAVKMPGRVAMELESVTLTRLE